VVSNLHAVSLVEYFKTLITGGDGPMRIALEQMRENFQLQDRVEMLGHVNHSDVRDVLTRGHIYLNCSLTEAFCIAILEAASCGLLVVSTKVGGVPEVLPSHMIKYALPDPREMVDVLAHAILHQCKDVNPQRFHDEVKRIYSWHDVTHRTCKVLSSALRLACRAVPPLRLAWRAVPSSQRFSPLCDWHCMLCLHCDWHCVLCLHRNDPHLCSFAQVYDRVAMAPRRDLMARLQRSYALGPVRSAPSARECATGGSHWCVA